MKTTQEINRKLYILNRQYKDIIKKIRVEELKVKE